MIVHLVEYLCMKKVLLLSCILLCFLPAKAQTYKYYTNSFSCKTYANGSWTDWSQWEDSHILVVISLDKNIISIYSEKIQEYDIYEYGGKESDNNGGESLNFSCVDRNGLPCGIRFRIQSDGAKQLYIDYKNAIWVYGLIESWSIYQDKKYSNEQFNEKRDKDKIIYKPYVRKSTTGSVYIKSIKISYSETRVDFVTCYTGNYIFLYAPGTKNALYIRANDQKYKLKKVLNIAMEDKVTFCPFNSVIEFSAIFEPFQTVVSELDVIEGESGEWNFYGVSTSNVLGGDNNIPNLYELGKRNYESHMRQFNKSLPNNEVKRFPAKPVRKRKQLQKDSNFKID